MDDDSKFFTSPEVRAVLERAVRVAGTPVSVHAHGDGGEQAHVAGCGGCEACLYVATLPWGRQHCRVSRVKAAQRALRRGKPEPFVCHMGFACVAVPGRAGADSRHAITFGPYCPAGTESSLASSVRARLETMTRQTFATLPFALGDVRPLDSGAVCETAAWTSETLTIRFDQRLSTQPMPPGEDESSANSSPDYRKRRYPRPVRDPYQAADIATALAARDQTRVRALVRQVLAQSESGKRNALQVKRRRAVALTAAVLEAAERLGLDTSAAEEPFAALPMAVQETADGDALVRVVTKVFVALKRRAAASTVQHYGFPQLYAVLMDHLVDGITLQDAASMLGEQPSTISKRLRRKASMSFSEFAGRLRIDKAKELLRARNLSVKEVAQRVGFSDPGNFSKLFRRYEDYTPSQYRARFRSAPMETSRKPAR